MEYVIFMPYLSIIRSDVSKSKQDFTNRIKIFKKLDKFFHDWETESDIKTSENTCEIPEKCS